MSDYPRILGTYSSNKPGPLLLVSAGIHGNEPSGVQALQNVFRELDKTRPEIEGNLLGITGNLAALKENLRYLDEDLNRAWSEDNVAGKSLQTSEQKEVSEIVQLLQDYPLSKFTKRIFLDCHTTSSDTLPYISVQDVNDNLSWAHQFPTYIIKGFSDIVYGCFDHYLSRIGLTGFVFEAGAHDDPKAVKNHEGVIWLALEKACQLDLEKVSTFPECVDRFASENSPKQKTFELIHRHGLEEGDHFQMQPGYENFQSVSKGEYLAQHNGEKILARHNARIFMPLYQNQGNDGFFIIEEVS